MHTWHSLLSLSFLQINIEDLEEGPVVNGERCDGPLTDAVVSGSKRRSQSGSAEPKKDGEVDDETAPLEQVWGRVGTRGAQPHTLCCHFLNFILLIAQLTPNFLGSCDQL